MMEVEDGNVHIRKMTTDVSGDSGLDGQLLAVYMYYEINDSIYIEDTADLGQMRYWYKQRTRQITRPTSALIQLRKYLEVNTLPAKQIPSYQSRTIALHTLHEDSVSYDRTNSAYEAFANDISQFLIL